MDNEASLSSSASASASASPPVSVYSGVLRKLEVSEKLYDRHLSNARSAIEEARSLCRFINTQGKENVINLEENLKQLLLEKKAQTEQEKEHTSLVESLELLNNRTQELERRIMELSDVRKQQKELIASQLSEAEAALEEMKVKNDLLHDSYCWFERFLGFRAQYTKNNGLSIILTKVLPHDLDREFSFNIRHDQEFSLLECNPAMDCAKDLLKELNQTNDWSKFISNMRNMFRTEFS